MSTWEPHAPSAGPRSAGAAGGPGVHFATGTAHAAGSIQPLESATAYATEQLP